MSSGIKEGQGITLALTTLSSIVLNLLDINQDGASAGDINSSDQATTGYETYVGTTLVEGGTYTANVNWNLLDQSALMGAIGVTDVMTVTYPKSVSTATTAAKDAVPIYINNISKTGAKGDLIKGTIAFKVAGTPTFTDEVPA